MYPIKALKMVWLGVSETPPESERICTYHGRQEQGCARDILEVETEGEEAEALVAIPSPEDPGKVHIVPLGETKHTDGRQDRHNVFGNRFPHKDGDEDPVKELHLRSHVHLFAVQGFEERHDRQVVREDKLGLVSGLGQRHRWASTTYLGRVYQHFSKEAGDSVAEALG